MLIGVKQMDIVTRVFQAGATADTYNRSTFETVVSALRRNLASENVDRIIVVTNVEAGNKLAEIVDQDGVAPTARYIKEAFASEGDRVMVMQCANWGKNPGSAAAVTYGAKQAVELGAKQIMAWSPELAVGPSHIARALAFLESRGLDVVGFHREHWIHKIQWHVFQNTGAIYARRALVETNYFSADCDGNTGRTIEVPGFGTVPLAGMDDFHFLLRHLKNFGEVRWGMVGREKPLPWNVSFEPGSQRALQHAQKVARQEAVMYAYIADIFGATDRNDQDLILNKIFEGWQMD